MSNSVWTKEFDQKYFIYGFLGLFALIVVPLILFGERTPEAPPTQKSSGTQTNIATLRDKQICIAGIAKIFYKNPEIIHIDSINSEVIFLSYIRPEDATEWKYKCKVSGNKIIWGADDGRWRDSPPDTVVSYELQDEYISITEKYCDGSSSNELFFFVQLK